ncbi:hypothetical protein GIB67_025521 [Kingdonia uniflora]|uniref:Uncharacterized protein n=1 Tax=Kingdonia uniflora TaxID=39325 RepID=A0A7J7M0D9_9MAGN|nr:hypothetical protein GIB67_025521 [Kingdonia uniflora]
MKEREVWNVKRDNGLQDKELIETTKALERFKKDYELKNKECEDTWLSLRELQNELMRKSMHVGSLACNLFWATLYPSLCHRGTSEGEVTWFSSLRDLTNKLKMLKMEHNRISAEALEYKKCIKDVTEMTSTIQSVSSQKLELERDHKAFKLKFIEGTKEQKKLYNRGTYESCRCRPLTVQEASTRANMAIDFDYAKDGEQDKTSKIPGQR